MDPQFISKVQMVTSCQLTGFVHVKGITVTHLKWEKSRCQESRFLEQDGKSRLFGFFLYRAYKVDVFT